MSHQQIAQGSPGAPAQPQPRTVDAASKLFFIVLGILAVGAGIVMGIWNPFLRNAVSTQGKEIDILFGLALGVATCIFVIVEGTLVYSIVRFGREPGDDSDAAPIRGNVTLEALWTAIPAITLVVLAIMSYRILAEIDTLQPDALPVEVIATQFAWQFYYPDADVTSAELHLPLNRQAHLKMRSKDVIHSFWVPALRMKKDVLPDRVTEMLLTPTEVGTYTIHCSELCGAGHGLMLANLVVQSAPDFESWLEGQAAARQQQAGAAGGASDVVAQGSQVFAQARCGGCHALGQAHAAGLVGPSLDGIGTRAAMTVPGESAEEYISSSIVKPNDYIVPGYQPLMPGDYSITLSEAELSSLTQFLLAQK